MHLSTSPLLLLAVFAAGHVLGSNIIQLSRADGNTNMPELIDIGQLIAPAATPSKPRPTARIEDVGAAAIAAAANQAHPKVGGNGS
ncbi:hypothetical protein GGI21_005261, partial [Coemansia aciculifera]